MYVIHTSMNKRILGSTSTKPGLSVIKAICLVIQNLINNLYEGLIVYLFPGMLLERKYLTSKYNLLHIVVIPYSISFNRVLYRNVYHKTFVSLIRRK